MWSWKYRRPQFAGAWRANSTFPITSHLDKNVELHILVRGGIELTKRWVVLEAHSPPKRRVRMSHFAASKVM